MFGFSCVPISCLCAKLSEPVAGTSLEHSCRNSIISPIELQELLMLSKHHIFHEGGLASEF